MPVMVFEGFEFPSAVTAFFVLHYIWVDTFAVGAARTPYQLKYPFTTETHDAKNLEPFIRALRAQQNQDGKPIAWFGLRWGPRTKKLHSSWIKDGVLPPARSA
eukprot:s4653_g8.t1